MTEPISIPQQQRRPSVSFKGLLRSLSRSSPRIPSPSANNSRSPPPDSYFPRPPQSQDGEATGQERAPETRGARATDFGDSTQRAPAPGLAFSPRSPGAMLQPSSATTNDGIDGGGRWEPSVRRSTSQRVNNPSAPPATSRTRSQGEAKTIIQIGAGSDDSKQLSVADEYRLPTLSKEPTRGVQLEDKPLSRQGGSIHRAKSAVKRAVQGTGYVETPKGAGELRVLLLVADGCEEIEVFTIFDLLVRAGLHPTIASISPSFSPSQSLPYITLSRGARILSDVDFQSLSPQVREDYDAIVIPGGAKGAERLSQCEELLSLVKRYHAQGKVVGMICAGILVAKASKIARGEKVTSHPSVQSSLEKYYDYSEESVVVSKNLITSRGPGTAIIFALQIIESLAGVKKRVEVEGPLMIPC